MIFKLFGEPRTSYLSPPIVWLNPKSLRKSALLLRKANGHFSLIFSFYTFSGSQGEEKMRYKYLFSGSRLDKCSQLQSNLVEKIFYFSSSDADKIIFQFQKLSKFQDTFISLRKLKILRLDDNKLKVDIFYQNLY